MKRIIIRRFGNYINTIDDGYRCLENWIRNNVAPTPEYATQTAESNYCDIFRDNMTREELIREAEKQGMEFQFIKDTIK